MTRTVCMYIRDAMSLRRSRARRVAPCSDRYLSLLRPLSNPPPFFYPHSYLGTVDRSPLHACPEADVHPVHPNLRSAGTHDNLLASPHPRCLRRCFFKPSRHLRSPFHMCHRHLSLQPPSQLARVCNGAGRSPARNNTRRTLTQNICSPKWTTLPSRPSCELSLSRLINCATAAAPADLVINRFSQQMR